MKATSPERDPIDQTSDHDPAGYACCGEFGQGMEGLRTYPPQRNKGIKRRSKSSWASSPLPRSFPVHIQLSEGRITYARGFQEVLGYCDEDVDVGLIFGMYIRKMPDRCTPESTRHRSHDQVPILRT